MYMYEWNIYINACMYVCLLLFNPLLLLFNIELKCHGLNFGPRVTQASKKNFQLINPYKGTYMLP